LQWLRTKSSTFICLRIENADGAGIEREMNLIWGSHGVLAKKINDILAAQSKPNESEKDGSFPHFKSP